MSGSASAKGYLASSLTGFLELVSAAEPAPAGGSAAALAVALAAGLCVMMARLSEAQLEEAPELAASAEALRERAAALVVADAAAFGQVLTALQAPRDREPKVRRRGIAAALSGAADVPTELACIAAAVGAIAARVAESGNPNLLGDAVTAALLAEAGSRAAAALVTINLKDSPADDRHRRVAQAVLDTSETTARARGVIELSP